MKRKEPDVSKNGSSAHPQFFLDQTLLVIEGPGLPTARANAIIKQVSLKGGVASLIKSTRLVNGEKLTPQERDKKLWNVTQIITGHSNAKDILNGLNIAQGGEEPSFKIVHPNWVTECLSKKSLIDTKPFEVPMEATAATTTTAQSPNAGASSSSPAGKGTPGSGGGATGGGGSPTNKRPRGDPFADFPPECTQEIRKAILDWGEPLSIDKPKDFPRYACQRPAPLHHPNKALANHLDEIEKLYRAIGDKEREISFGRTNAVIRAWPRRIRSSLELKGVAFCGEKSRIVVDEFLNTGRSERLDSLKKEKRNMSLLDLTRVHQVGHKTAVQWYDQGYHSVDQILQEFDEAPGGNHELTQFYRKCSPSFEPLIGLLYFREYDIKMDRATVAEIGELVRAAAAMVIKEKGFGPETLLVEICGGYRRGKELNGDADVLVSCTEARGFEGLREGIAKVMVEEMKIDMIFLKQGEGVVQSYSNARPHEKLGSHGKSQSSNARPHEKVGSHDNMLTLMKHKGLYRRVDVICPPPDQWGPCVLGWSGTKQMEKDLRDWAHDVRHTSLSQQAVFNDSTGKRATNPKSEDGFFNKEEDIWEFLGLKYLPPMLRWA